MTTSIVRYAAAFLLVLSLVGLGAGLMLSRTGVKHDKLQGTDKRAETPDGLRDRHATASVLSEARPALTDQEMNDGWLLLFDGKTTAGWNAPAEAKVVKGELVIAADQKQLRFITNAEFQAYELVFDYRVEGKGQVMRLDHVGPYGSRSHCLSMSSQEWHTCTVRRAYDSRPGTNTMTAKFAGGRFGGEIKWGPDPGKPIMSPVGFDVRQQTKLVLRGVKIKPDNK